MSNQTIQDLYNQELVSTQSPFNNPDMFINRELSWLDFNRRVLHQTIREDVPLLERLKFLGITSSNLDEFIMVRMSSILNRIDKNPLSVDISGITPEEEYAKVYKEVMDMKQSQEEIFYSLKKKMHKVGITIVRHTSLSKQEKIQMEKTFLGEIYPLITPISLDTTKDIPMLKSRQLSLVVGLSDKDDATVNVVSLVPFDQRLERFYRIGSSNRFVLLEDLVGENLKYIFMNKEVLFRGTVRLLREADIEMETDDDIFITDRMKETLREREESYPVFMDVGTEIPKQALKLIMKIFHLDKSRLFKSKTMLDYSSFVGGEISDSMYEYDSFEPQYPQELVGEHNMFTAIDSGDIILHHPYESFVPITKFLDQAADDPNVLAIKQTLYRVASVDSPIVEALCRAAQNGKQVSILLEIKARFDEEKNLSLISKLKASGCNVLYGVEKLKTHAKFIVVVKRTKKGLRSYCHIGTGNYNNKTAKIYTDLSLFTSNAKIGQDVLTIFNILSGFSDPQDAINKVLYSPYNIRSKLYELIDREIAQVEKGNKSYITLKLNSLSDRGIIKKLYEAASKGVSITVFVRGICSMKPVNKNIVIRSLVGRYLEHSRIYYFYNNGKPDVYISSADFLTRNLDRRVEIMVPLSDEDVKTKVLDILSMYFDDTFNTYQMNTNGKYKQIDKRFDVNIHSSFMKQAIDNYKYRKIPKMSLKQK